MKNLGLKLWSVVIALALTIFVHSQSNQSVMPLIVPVELRNLPSDRVALLPNAPQAQVTLRGPSYMLADIANDPLSFSIRVPEEVGNRYVTALQSTMLQLPPSVEVMNIDPSEIEFVLDTLIEKDVKVDVPRIGSLKEDYRLVGIKVDPPKVKVTGPKTELESLEAIESDQIDLRGFTSSEERVLSLKERGRFVQIEPKKVAATVEVTTVIREKRYKDVPLTIVNNVNDTTYVVSPSRVVVEISGPKFTVNKLNKKDLQATVQIPEGYGSSPEKTPKELPITLNLPERVELIYLSPEKVNIKRK